jgi:Zn-dependent peptidase ImmA (M78 family)
MREAPASHDAAAETRGHEFGSHLLLPDTQLKEAFRGQSRVRLVQYKERFGISLAAMIYRAQASHVISESTARWLWIEFGKRGWRKNEPGHVRPDRATRLEQLMDGAIASGKLTWREAATVTGILEAELQQRVLLAMGLATTGDEAEGEDDGGILKFPE